MGLDLDEEDRGIFMDLIGQCLIQDGGMDMRPNTVEHCGHRMKVSTIEEGCGDGQSILQSGRSRQPSCDYSVHQLKL